MNSKKSGALFLTIIICFIVAEIVIGFTPVGDKLNELALMLISELSFMLQIGRASCGRQPHSITSV